MFTVAPHVPGSGAARWRRAAGEDPQKATFQRNRGQPHHAETGVGRQSHARRRSGAQGPEAGGIVLYIHTGNSFCLSTVCVFVMNTHTLDHKLLQQNYCVFLNFV